MLEELPDGIHSGLLRQGTKGVFFYFTAQRNVGQASCGLTRVDSSRQHYWRYIDLSRRQEGWTHRR